VQDFLIALYAGLDMVVLKRDSFKSYRRITLATDWYLNVLCSDEDATSQVLDEDNSTPFLDNFLMEVELSCVELSHQEGENFQNPLFSGIWAENDSSDQAVFFEAEAQLYKNEWLIIIRKLDRQFHSYREQLQIARDNMLYNERLEEEVRKRTAEVRNREEEIILRLLAASGARDDETAAHIKRIGLYSAVIAEALGWSKQAIDDIRLAAPMHDIGKIGIPDAVLLKPGKLDPDEWKIMQMHPVIGAKMLGDTKIPVLQMAAEISLHHHERYNGSGYPYGLKGDEIPASARIVSIVDVYDALMHKRVYKKAFDETAVNDMMRAELGKHFDPYIYEVFHGCYDQIREVCQKVPDNTS